MSFRQGGKHRKLHWTDGQGDDSEKATLRRFRNSPANQNIPLAARVEAIDRAAASVANSQRAASVSSTRPRTPANPGPALPNSPIVVTGFQVQAVTAMQGPSQPAITVNASSLATSTPGNANPERISASRSTSVLAPQQQTLPSANTLPESERRMEDVLEEISLETLRAIEADYDRILKMLEDEERRLEEERFPNLSSDFNQIRQKKPRPGGPQFRGQRRNNLVSDVHEYTLQLLGVIPSDGNGSLAATTIRLPPPPDNPEGAPPRDIDNFNYAWNRPKGHYYNQIVATNFAQAMVASEDYPWKESDTKEIREIFLTFASRTLAQRYKHTYIAPRSELDIFVDKEENNAQSRRLRLYYRRRHVTTLHQSLYRLTIIVERLGPSSMSDDEEDEDRRHGKRFLIIKKRWRSALLTHFLRVLDKLAEMLRIERRGQPFRTRVDSTRTSPDDPQVFLPYNCFSEEWNDPENTPEWKLDIFVNVDEEFDMTFPNWVHELLRGIESTGGAASEAGPSFTNQGGEDT